MAGRCAFLSADWKRTLYILALPALSVGEARHASLERFPNVSILILQLLPELSLGPQRETTRAEGSLSQEHCLPPPSLSEKLALFQASLGSPAGSLRCVMYFYLFSISDKFHQGISPLHPTPSLFSTVLPSSCFLPCIHLTDTYSKCIGCLTLCWLLHLRMARVHL